MKRIFSALLFTVAFACSAAVYAENNVSSIDIDVSVRDNGSAYITQVWRGTFDEGTENYIPINTDGLEISGLRVSDANGEYTYVDWDVNASFKEKARKCGINETNDGVELCFGISQYGENMYAIEYEVGGFIKGYSDYDGTNFMLINREMSTFPTDGKIRIVVANGTKLNAENTGIWAFGFEGQVEFQNGTVVAYTEKSLTGNNSMIVMLRLNKGIVSPAVTTDESFQAVIDEAMEGSDYDGEEEMPLWTKVLFCLIALAIVFVVITAIIASIKRKKEIKRFYKQADYYREVPNSGDLCVSHCLSQSFNLSKEKNLIIGAVILKLINSGCIEPQTDETVGFFGKVKKSVNLRLSKIPQGRIEAELYNILYAAAGEDGILQEKELEKYTYKHPKRLAQYVDMSINDGRSLLIQTGCYATKVGNCIKHLSDNGKKQLSELMGLKKYLADFSLIAERQISETEIWKDYLVYATLLGIADAAIEQFKKVYPNYTQEIDVYNRNVIIASSYYHTMNSSYNRAIADEARRSGGGGSSSIGGGGGFSGGGVGGGSR